MTATSTKIGYGTTAPTTGVWAIGDRVYNTSPAVGDPTEWICVEAGTPGVWNVASNASPVGYLIVTKVSDLREIAPTPGTKILVQGYYTIDDGGGGFFCGFTGAAPGTYVDNNGTIFVPTGGDGSSAWRRFLSDRISVKEFGAKGDGVTDDAAAIQAALNYCVKNDSILLFPTATFLVNTSLNLTFAGASGGADDFSHGIIIEGTGRNFQSVIKGNTSGYPVFDLTGARTCLISDILVYHVSDDATKPSCGFFLSRNTTNGPSGEHVFTNVGVFGYFSKAAIATISSEVNIFRACYFNNIFDTAHSFYTAGLNNLGILSLYIPGLDVHAYSGGNTRHYFDGTSFLHYGAGDGAGRPIYIKNDAVSLSSDLLFQACYSNNTGSLKVNSITIDGDCNDISMINHRDESQLVHCILITAGSVINSLEIIGGTLSRNVYGEDTSIVNKGFFAPERIATILDPVISKYLSFDLYGCNYSVFTSVGTNGIRFRNSALSTKIIGGDLPASDLIMDAVDANQAGFSAHVVAAGYGYDRAYGSTTRHFLQKVNVKGLTLANQDIAGAGTITPDASNGSHITVRLTAATLVSDLTGLIGSGSLDTLGGSFIITFVQDGVGGHVVTWGANFDLRGSSVALGANAVTSFMFVQVDVSGSGSNKLIRVG